LFSHTFEETHVSSASQPRPTPPGVAGQGQVIQVPNTLRAKVGGRLGALDASALAKAEQALKDLAGQFSQWLQDELDKLDAARAAIKTQGVSQERCDQLYLHAHDLKGLGTTYEYPLVSKIAGLLCKLIDEPATRTKAPMALIDVHIDAIKAAVRDQIRDTDHPIGRALFDELSGQVAAHLKG
jgi:hypothetical protein